jgi:hypothetical protein
MMWGLKEFLDHKGSKVFRGLKALQVRLEEKLQGR